MKRLVFLAMVTVAAILSVAGTGCSSKKTEKTKSPADTKTGGHNDHKSGHAKSGHGKHEHGKHEQSGKIKENLAKLSDADRALAEKQMTCPVSGDPLGSMGVPKKIAVKGQQVWICCDGCKEAIEKDPDKYLAKLKK